MRAKRLAQQSREVVEKAVASGDPFSYLYEHMDEMSCVSFDDFMQLLRVSPSITVTSHDIVDAYERHAHRENRYAAILWDVLYLLRNRGRNEDTTSK